jgi:peptidoglycan/xylan/chitin deacetylase (PgdA/CDA1 family)
MKTLRFWAAETRRQFISRVGRRPMTLGNDNTIVSFCFDDFPRSALTVGGTILEAHGARGTFYAAPGLMGTDNELGEQFLQEDLDTLLRVGHELGCHTLQHLSCRSVTQAEFMADVDEGRKVIHRMTGYDPINFAYPYGHVTASLKKKIGTQMDSCRGIFGGVNGPVVDLNLLRANSLYGDIGEIGAVTELLSDSEGGGWLIFYTHDVRDRPSPYGCTPALLREAVAETLNRGFTIAPVADVIAAERRSPPLGGEVTLTPSGRSREVVARGAKLANNSFPTIKISRQAR